MVQSKRKRKDKIETTACRGDSYCGPLWVSVYTRNHQMIRINPLDLPALKQAFMWLWRKIPDQMMAWAFIFLLVNIYLILAFTGLLAVYILFF